MLVRLAVSGFALVRLAVSLFCVGQIGCALGFLIPPEIVPDVDDFDVLTSRLRIMLYSTAIVTVTFFILVLISTSVKIVFNYLSVFVSRL